MRDCPFLYSSSATTEGKSKRQGLTYGSVYNLQSTNGGYACIKDGQRCAVGMSFDTLDVTVEILNSGKVTMRGEDMVKEVGYRLEGHEKSYISDGTITPVFDFQSLVDARTGEGCIEKDKFAWYVLFSCCCFYIMIEFLYAAVPPHCLTIQSSSQTLRR